MFEKPYGIKLFNTLLHYSIYDHESNRSSILIFMIFLDLLSFHIQSKLIQPTTRSRCTNNSKTEHCIFNQMLNFFFKCRSLPSLKFFIFQSLIFVSPHINTWCVFAELQWWGSIIISTQYPIFSKSDISQNPWCR